MRAIRVREYGGPEVLVLEEVEDPRPADGHVVIRLDATGVNMIDVQQRSGARPKRKPSSCGERARPTSS